MNETAPRNTGTPPGAPAYRFADLTLHLGQHRLERDGKLVELGRLTYALLVALLEAAPNVLTHDDLVRTVWNGRSTTPETVTQRVKLLRDALGDDAEQPRYIGLVRGQGYRLIPSVDRMLEPAGSVDSKRGRNAIVAVSLLALATAAYLALSRPSGTDAHVTAAPGTLDFDIKPLTDPGRVGAPAISPDGQVVVYPQLEADGLMTLWVQQVATGSRQKVLDGDPAVSARVPTVSPDGTFIDFINPDQESALWRVPLFGGTARRFTSFVATPIAWSADGKLGAFVRYEDNGDNTVLVVREPDGTERVLARRVVPEAFVSLNTGGAAVRPAWSPDGRLIALFEFTSLFKLRLTFFDSESGEQQSTLDLENGSLPQGLGWLRPSALVFSQPVGIGQRLQLWSMSYPSGAITPLTNDLSSYRGIDLDSSHTRLVTQGRDRRTAVWIGDATGAHAVEVVPWTPYGGTDIEVPMSWAGDRLLYDGSFNGRPGISELTSDGRLTGEVIADAFLAAASPDGETVVFNRPTGDRGIWRGDASGQPPVRLFSGVAGARVVTGDRSVVFVSIRSGVQSPWIVPLDGGEPVEIIRENMVSLDVSPDGRWLAYYTPDLKADGSGEPTLVVCELPRCSNPHRLAAPSNYGGVLRWTPDGKELGYLNSALTDIWATPLDGGAPRAITSFGRDPDRIVGFAWSRDGRRLAFVREKVEERVVLLSLKL